MIAQGRPLLFKPHSLNGLSDNPPIAPLRAFDASTREAAVVSAWSCAMQCRGIGGFTVPLDRGNYDA